MLQTSLHLCLVSCFTKRKAVLARSAHDAERKRKPNGHPISEFDAEPFLLSLPARTVADVLDTPQGG